MRHRGAAGHRVRSVTLQRNPREFDVVAVIPDAPIARLNRHVRYEDPATGNVGSHHVPSIGNAANHKISHVAGAIDVLDVA